MKKYSILILPILLLLNACNSYLNIRSNSRPVSHHLWDTLLNKHVDTLGFVDYKGFITDSNRLNQYLDTLKKGYPNDKNWTKEEQLAYWINAYNAFTVQLIIRNYPLNGIKEIGGSIPFVNTTWDIKFITIEGVTLDLNNIEHSIIRKKFREPRIHFAIVCASISCPKLRNQAFTAKKIDRQLTEQAIAFIQNEAKNQLLSPSHAKLSKIFTWFKKDFTRKYKNLPTFINQYSNVRLNADAKLEFLDYNWSLNEQ